MARKNGTVSEPLDDFAYRDDPAADVVKIRPGNPAFRGVVLKWFQHDFVALAGA